MKNLIIFSLYICSFTLFSQNEDNHFKEKYERFYLEVGTVIPTGQLKNQFSTSANFGLWYRQKTVFENYVDYGVSLYIPNQPKPIFLNYADNIQETRSRKFAGSVNVRFSKVYPINLSYQFETHATAGFGFYSYDISFRENPNNCGEKNDQPCSNFHTFNTLHLGLGAKLRYKNVGIYMQYNYAPYYLFSKYIDKSFGEGYISLGLVYYQ